MMIRVPTATSGDMAAYLAIPKAGKGPGVVVLQEIFGVTGSMKQICDFLASRQFTAICPDLFHSVEPNLELAESEFEKARSIRYKMDDNLVVRDIGATMEFLRQSDVCTGAVGVVGYCWGGLLAYLTAANQSPDAAVAYYGVGIDKHLDKAAQITCPMMFHYASKDAFAGPDVAAKVRETFQGKNAQVWEYKDAGHAFARPGGSHYHHPSADLADMRTLSFLVEQLIGKGKAGTMTV